MLTGLAAPLGLDPRDRTRVAPADQIPDAISLHLRPNGGDFPDHRIARNEGKIFRSAVVTPEHAQLGAGGDHGVERAHDDVLVATRSELKFRSGDFPNAFENDGLNSVLFHNQM